MNAPGKPSAYDAEVPSALAAQRGIFDHESGSAIVLEARKQMTKQAAVRLGSTIALDDTTLTMFGLLTRLQAFNEGAAREIDANNPFASASCIRSLAEVVALICHLIEKPADLHRISMQASQQHRFSVGKLLRAAQREAPGFEAVYEQLSNFAHPSYVGSTASMRVTDGDQFSWTSTPQFKYDSEAFTMYLWVLELTEAGGMLWCRLYDAVRGASTL